MDVVAGLWLLWFWVSLGFSEFVLACRCFGWGFAFWVFVFAFDLDRACALFDLRWLGLV